MYPAEAHLELVTGQSFLHKAESLRKIRGKISFRRRYTWRGQSNLNPHRRSVFSSSSGRLVRATRFEPSFFVCVDLLVRAS
jgi:hypothetical protein